MNKNHFFVTLSLITLLGFSSCKECKQCSAVADAETFVDGQSFGTISSEISAVEYCGDDLEMIESSSPIESEITQEVQGISQRIVTTTTYTCN